MLELRQRVDADTFTVPYRDELDNYTAAQSRRKSYAANRAVWDSPVVVEMWYINADGTEYQLDTLTCELEITIENLADEVDDTVEEPLE